MPWPLSITCTKTMPRIFQLHLGSQCRKREYEQEERKIWEFPGFSICFFFFLFVLLWFTINSIRRMPKDQGTFLVMSYCFLFYFISKLYNIVLVLPNIEMNPPQVYMCSPSWTPLPPPSPYHPSGSCLFIFFFSFSFWVVPVHQPQASSIVHWTWTGISFHLVLNTGRV